jgi:ribose transport system substrate-binding protein
LRDVLAADIPLIYFVCSSDAVPASTFITSDNYSLAFRIADYLITALGGKGNLVLLEGAANSPTSAPRTQGFLDAMAPHSDITCAAQARGDYQLADARDAMTRILVENPTIHGVLAANDFMAMGVIEALEAAEAVGPSTPVVGINAMPKAISAIQQGRLLATAAFDAMAMACIAAEAAHRVILGEAVPPVIELPVEIVEGGNCGQWDLPYEQRPLPDWASATSA